MASEWANRAEDGSHVGLQIAHLEGDFNQYHASVRAATEADRNRLAETHRRVREALSGGLSVLAQQAAIIAAAKGPQ